MLSKGDNETFFSVGPDRHCWDLSPKFEVFYGAGNITEILRGTEVPISDPTNQPLDEETFYGFMREQDEHGTSLSVQMGSQETEMELLYIPS